MARLPIKPSAAAKKKKLLKPLKLLWNITLRTCLVISRIFSPFLCLHRHPWCRLWRNRSLSSLVIGKIKVILHQRVNFTACVFLTYYIFQELSAYVEWYCVLQFRILIFFEVLLFSSLPLFVLRWKTVLSATWTHFLKTRFTWRNGCVTTQIISVKDMNGCQYNFVK